VHLTYRLDIRARRRGVLPIDVKICGLTEPGGVAAALEAGAEMLGFVFFPPSPRNISVDQAFALAAPARGHARIVALTVDADDATLDAIVSGLGPDLLQFHGNESPRRITEIHDRLGVPAMKALGVQGRADMAEARSYLGVVERLLFDAKPPPDATRPGGLGRAFDWRLLADLDLPVPYMLSGGLDRDCVGEAISIAHPQGVDVSSGVESAPGIKEPQLVRDFIAEVRAAEPRGPAREKEGVAQ
jgi:phosphoribosylanthranilate isomerase